MKFNLLTAQRNEFREGNYAVQEYIFRFLGIPIYKHKYTSTNNDAVRKLTIVAPNSCQVVGFSKDNKNETENSNRKSQ